jgi:hypothetical protein
LKLVKQNATTVKLNKYLRFKEIEVIISAKQKEKACDNNNEKGTEFIQRNKKH